MKHEWKKHEKELYLPKTSPVQVVVPQQMFFMLHGQGDPNGEEFAEAIGVLYSLSYAVKMLLKKADSPDENFDYAVYPPHAIWHKTEAEKPEGRVDKSELVYSLMIRQPIFITREIVYHAKQSVRKKKPHPLLDKIGVRCFAEGLCVQMLHVGPYDDEPASFEKMDSFCLENGLERTDETHREIYLSDPQKTAPEKLKTVLRYTVAAKNDPSARHGVGHFDFGTDTQINCNNCDNNKSNGKP